MRLTQTNLDYLFTYGSYGASAEVKRSSILSWAHFVAVTILREVSASSSFPPYTGLQAFSFFQKGCLYCWTCLVVFTACVQQSSSMSHANWNINAAVLLQHAIN
jgi:hypothetical protein